MCDSPEIYETEVVVQTPQGLHARPAALLAQTAQQYASALHIQAGQHTVDAKSILDILSLAATQGTTLTLVGRGPDCREAVEKLSALIRSQFTTGAAASDSTVQEQS